MLDELEVHARTAIYYPLEGDKTWMLCDQIPLRTCVLDQDYADFRTDIDHSEGELENVFAS
jgi:hypothetical protein